MLVVKVEICFLWGTNWGLRHSDDLNISPFSRQVQDVWPFRREVQEWRYLSVGEVSRLQEMRNDLLQNGRIWSGALRTLHPLLVSFHSQEEWDHQFVCVFIPSWPVFMKSVWMQHKLYTFFFLIFNSRSQKRSGLSNLWRGSNFIVAFLWNWTESWRQFLHNRRHLVTVVYTERGNDAYMEISSDKFNIYTKLGQFNPPSSPTRDELK